MARRLHGRLLMLRRNMQSLAPKRNPDVYLARTWSPGLTREEADEALMVRPDDQQDDTVASGVQIFARPRYAI